MYTQYLQISTVPIYYLSVISAKGLVPDRIAKLEVSSGADGDVRLAMCRRRNAKGLHVDCHDTRIESAGN